MKAYKNGSVQTIPSGADTVITFVDDFDPQNWFSSNRFQPTVAGYYNLHLAVWWDAGSVTNNQSNIQLRKNGTTQVAIQQTQIVTGSGYGQAIDIITYFNGTTDYVEATAFTGNPTSQNINSASSGTWFTAALITNGVGPTGPTGSTGPAGPQGVTGPAGSGSTSSLIRTIGISLDGAGSDITTGVKGDVFVPYNLTIDSWTLFSPQTGSIVIDVWKSSYASYPPTVSNRIAGTERPTLATQSKNQDLVLSSWTTSVVENDFIRFNVDSCSGIQKVTLAIKCYII
jgi:hypothetical protein